MTSYFEFTYLSQVEQKYNFFLKELHQQFGRHVRIKLLFFFLLFVWKTKFLGLFLLRQYT